MAEITKRRLRGLHQNTQIGLSPAAATAASQLTFDGASASKHPQPDISIVLSLAPLDPSLPGYQPPITDEEILNACVDDEQEQDCGDGDGAASSDAAATSAAGPAPPPAGASSGASSGGAGASAVHAAAGQVAAGAAAAGEAAAGRVAMPTATATATAAAAAAGGDDDARAVVFLDIDGVLLPFGEGAPACAADGDPARSFPRVCLAALARLLEVSGLTLTLSSGEP